MLGLRSPQQFAAPIDRQEVNLKRASRAQGEDGFEDALSLSFRGRMHARHDAGGRTERGQFAAAKR